MFNRSTGFKLAVIAAPNGFPRVIVPEKQGDQVRQLLIESGIGHSVGATLADHDCHERVIQIGRLWNARLVQDVLDRCHN